MQHLLTQIIRMKTSQQIDFQNPESAQKNDQTPKSSKPPLLVEQQQTKKNGQAQLNHFKQEQIKAYLGHLNLLYMYLQNSTFYQQLKNRYPGLIYLSNQEKRNLISSGQVVRLSESNKIIQLEVTQRKMLIIIHGDVQYLGRIYKKGQCFYTHPQLGQDQNNKINQSYRLEGSASELKSSIMKSQIRSFQRQKQSSIDMSNSKGNQMQSSNNQTNTFLGATLRLILQQQQKSIRMGQEDNELAKSQKQIIFEESKVDLTKAITLRIINKTSLLGINYQQFQFYVKLFQEEYDKKCLLEKIINPLKRQGQNATMTSQVIKKLAYRMRIFETRDNLKILNPDSVPQFQAFNTIYDVLGVQLKDNSQKTMMKTRANSSKWTYLLLNKKNQAVAQLENTYAGQQILWTESYDYRLRAKSLYAKYGVISREEFIACVGEQAVKYLKTVYSRKLHQRSRVQRQHQVRIDQTAIKKSKQVFSKVAIHQKALQAIRFKKSSKTQPLVQKHRTQYSYEQLSQIKDIVQSKVKQFKQEQLKYTAPHNRFLHKSVEIKRKRWPTSRPKTQMSQQKQLNSSRTIEASPQARFKSKSSMHFMHSQQTLQQKGKKQIQKVQKCKKSISESAILLSNKRKYEMQKYKTSIKLSKVRLFDNGFEIQSLRNRTYYELKNQHPSQSKTINNMKRLFKIAECKGPNGKRSYTFR